MAWFSARSLRVRLTAQQPLPTQFQESTGISIVRVDVTVRDSKGMVVRGLQAKDFTILEDGKPQKIANFEFQDIDAAAAAPDTQVALLDGLEDKLRADVKRAASATSAAADNEAIEKALAEAKALTNRRMWVLLFDVSSMQPEDVQRAVESGMKWVDSDMTNADMVARRHHRPSSQRADRLHGRPRGRHRRAADARLFRRHRRQRCGRDLHDAATDAAARLDRHD